MKTLIYEGDFIATRHIGNKDYFDENGDCILTEITGNAFFRCWKGNAPVLTNIGGDAFFIDWKGNAPVLTNIGRSAYFEGWKGSATLLSNIGGNAYLSGWKGSAPLLNEKYIFSILLGSRKTNCKFEKATKQYFTGCFNGNEEHLIKAINKTHEKNSIYYNQYMDFIKQCNN